MAAGPDAQSIAAFVEIYVLSGETCWFGWSKDWLWEGGFWIQVLTSFQIPESPPLLEFHAYVDLGGKYTETVCPFGDGHDGRTCHATEK